MHYLVRMLLAIAAGWAAAALCREVYVAPAGAPGGDGSLARPFDLKTALTSEAAARPGDTVWLQGGTYTGPFVKPDKPAGTENEPIIYRAVPGQRVTLTAPDDAGFAIRFSGAAYVWLWGCEVTSRAVEIKGGREIKLINLFIHDAPKYSGIQGSNLGSEFYGCLIYRNGLHGNALAHGTYTQNRPEDVGGDLDALPWKVHRDCIVFNNYGWGIHSYATAPRLAKLLFEGNVCYGNGMPEGSEKPTCNFLAGGQKFDDLVVVRDCFTYYPDAGDFKRGADLGYGDDNGRVTVERCHFIGGKDTIWIRRWQQAAVKETVFFTAGGKAVNLSTIGPRVPAEYAFERNTYYSGLGTPFQWNDATFTELAAWQNATGLDKTSTLVAGRPREAWTFLRPNKYEPDKAYLLIYNWPRTSEVKVDMGRLWDLKGGETVRAVSVEDIWGQPVVEGRFAGQPVAIRMAGTYAPEFACYLLVKQAAGEPQR